MLKKCLNVESKPDNNAQSQVFYLQDQNPQYVCLFIWVLYFVLFFCFTMLRLETKTLSMLNKHSHTELPSPFTGFQN